MSSFRNAVSNLNHRINKVFHDIRFGDNYKRLITLTNEMRDAFVTENKLIAGAPGVGFGIGTTTKVRMNGPIRYQIGGQTYSSVDVGLATKTEQLIALANELRTDHATSKTVVTDIKTLVNALRTQELNRCVTPPTFVIDTNYDIKNSVAFEIIVAGVLVTIAADQSFDTGTSEQISTDAYFAAAILSIDLNATTHVDWGAEAVDAATALTNLDVVTASGAVVCGTVVVEAKGGVGETWTGASDALTTGTGGNVANSTVYANNQYVGDAVIGAAVSTSAPDTLTAAAADLLSGAAEAVLDSDGQDITATKYGAWRFQISKLGALTTTASHDTTDMAYESAELALLALANQALVANTVVVGYLVIQAAGGGFTIGTDDPKAADAAVTSATYYDVQGDTGLIAAATGVVSGTAEELNIGAATVKVNGVQLAAVAADLTLPFPLIDTVTTLKWGAWLIVTDLVGTGHYVQSVDGDTTASLMAYASFATALAAADAMIAAMPNRFVVLGVLYIHNGAKDPWTAQTDDITDGSDVTESLFKMRILGEGIQAVDAAAVKDIIGAVGD